MLENAIKGYMLSLIGLVVFFAILAHGTGFYEFPNPTILHKGWEIGLGLLLSFGLIVFPKSKIESFVEQGWAILLGLFKNKVDKKEEIK